MTFPTVASSNNSSEPSDTTSHTVNLPSNIASGDLLIVFIATDGNNQMTYPEGWNEFFALSEQLACHLSIAWRKADGTEGASITVTSSHSETSAHISYRITGAEDPTTQAPEASTGATGSSTNPDPDSLTPTGGAKDYLWIAIVSQDGAFTKITAYPTNYTDGEYKYDAGACVGLARRELNASSENPGTFTTSNDDNWVACTIAVYPSSSTAGGKVHVMASNF